MFITARTTRGTARSGNAWRKSPGCLRENCLKPRATARVSSLFSTSVRTKRGNTSMNSPGSLVRGGRLVILDLLSHRFEKARELYADHWLGFSEVKLHQLLERSGFREIEVSVVSREKQNPHFQTVFATGVK